MYSEYIQEYIFQNWENLILGWGTKFGCLGCRSENDDFPAV